METTINGISIINNNRYIVFENTINNGHFTHRLENDSIAFYEPGGNLIHNRPRMISDGFKTIHLTEIGQVAIASTGQLVAYLSTEKILQRIENTFYEEGQTRIYDFINQLFTIDL